jgi:hypothetical protein
LIQQELQAIMVGADGEGPPPNLRSPVANGLNKTDQHTFIGR